MVRWNRPRPIVTSGGIEIRRGGSWYTRGGCGHCHRVSWLPAVVQRYMAAYARQGRHASARRSSSRMLFRAKARSRPRSPDGNASGSPSARIATYCAVHFPMPGISHMRARKSRHRTIPSKRIRPSADRRRKSANRLPPRAWAMPRPERLASARTSGDGKRCVRPPGAGNGCPERSYQAAGEGGSAFHGYLLAEYGAHRQFEAVPAARYAHARIRLHALGPTPGPLPDLARWPPNPHSDRTWRVCAR